jgi:hypothetical protein
MGTHSFLPLKQLPKHASSCYKQIPKHAYMFDAILTNLDVFRVAIFLELQIPPNTTTTTKTKKGLDGQTKSNTPNTITPTHPTLTPSAQPKWKP